MAEEVANLPTLDKRSQIPQGNVEDIVYMNSHRPNSTNIHCRSMRKSSIIPLLFLAQVAFANDGATNVAKEHIHAIIHILNGFSGQEMEQVKYALAVQLLPGHELLKDQYKLTQPGARRTGATIGQDKVLEALSKIETNKKPRAAERDVENPQLCEAGCPGRKVHHQPNQSRRNSGRRTALQSPNRGCTDEKCPAQGGLPPAAFTPTWGLMIRCG